MFTNTPEATLIVDRPKKRPAAFGEPRVYLDRYGSWRIADGGKIQAWDIQRSFVGYREACLFRDALIAYASGDVEAAGDMHQKAMNGERWLRHR